MRGRLIFQFQAELARLDTSATEAGGTYHSAFREPRKVDSDGDGIGEETQQYHTADLIPCQVEDAAWMRLDQHTLGNNPDVDLTLVFHFQDLEDMGLVYADGNARIHQGDKLVSIKDIDGNTVHEVTTPPGLYVTEARPASYGLCMADPHRNLLIVRFQERRIE